MGKRKLNDAQRVTIREMHRKKGVSVRALASIFSVSRATIRFVLNPQLEETNRERTKLRQRRIREAGNDRGNTERQDPTPPVQASGD